MRAKKYDYWVKIRDIRPPLNGNEFAATAEIHEIGNGPVEHNLGEQWGNTREEADGKMRNIIQQWIQVNEK